MTLRFTKMNGAGNDFVVIDNRDEALRISSQEIAKLCDRHRGVGADGLLLVELPLGDADFRMRYYNSDGGEAEMCANGARCFARYASRVSEKKDVLRLETLAGMVGAEVRGRMVKLGLSEPSQMVLHRSLEIEGQKLLVHSINTGVPHVVVFVDDLENTPVLNWGSKIRYHRAFQPKGTNANFLQKVGPGKISVRTYERGVEGETLACGTGVAACGLIYSAIHELEPPVRVLVRGGDWMEVGFGKADSGFRDVTLEGPADFVFEGTVDLDQ
jgi:diaminopimelate epimerase